MVGEGDVSPCLQPCPVVTLERSDRVQGKSSSTLSPKGLRPLKPPAYFKSDCHFSILRFTGNTLLGILFSSQMISARVLFPIL